MFTVGSRIFHALHGLGVVESIEEKQILGRVHKFSVVVFEHLKILMNVEQNNKLVRPLVDASQVDEVLSFLNQAEEEQTFNYNRRYIANLERIKSGDIRQLCRVVKSLTKLADAKKLGHKDNSMLERARELLAQELGHLSNTDISEMQARIDQHCRLGSESTIEHGAEPVLSAV